MKFERIDQSPHSLPSTHFILQVHLFKMLGAVWLIVKVTEYEGLILNYSTAGQAHDVNISSPQRR